MEQPRQTPFTEKIANILPEFNNGHTPESFNITAETFSFFEDLLEANGFDKYTNPAEAYKELEGNRFIVRREDPRKVLQLLNNESYEIAFEGTRYSNCAEWNPHTDGSRGIANAYLEGMTNLNNVVTIIGFETTPQDDIEQLADATVNFHGLERDKVRSFKGTINPDAIQFVSLRVPGHFLSENELTDDEVSRVDEYLEMKERGLKVNPVMIHRTFVKEITSERIH
ncbi:MAG: hypothetical protein KBC62_00255 [Candidatus Pacebacteria bacterium]|nr:hypothetical protein [Candidatus Paceibacterota bacterium]MBP9842418.1 hypothetical protein [Candidatus Paceibacterota bacterium]